MLSPPAVKVAEADQVVEEWIEKWKNDSLCFADIDEVWRSWIPKIKNPLVEMTNSLKIFITMLNKFLFYGYSGDWIEQMLKREKLITCNRASSFNHQPFYFKCNECEDSNVSRTLCAECYENSVHRTHNYTMPIGQIDYCCCGEHGTWENTWYCTKHTEYNISHNEEQQNVLPQDVESRARIIIETIVVYAEDLLNCYKNIDQNEDEIDDECCLILYTNSMIEFDDFQHLMHCMLSITKEEIFSCSQKLIQRNRIYIKLPKTHCKSVSAVLKKQNSKFKTMVLRDDSVTRLEFAGTLLSYLQECLTYGEQFREIFCASILTPRSHSNQCFVENLLIFSWTLPKSICNTFQELIIYGVLKKLKTKECLAKMIMAKYFVIIHSIDMKQKEAINLLMAINVQLFSIPDLAQYFIAKENALSVAFAGYLEDTLKAYEEFENSQKNSQCDITTFNRSRCHTCFVEYLLGTVPKTWTNELREGFLNGLTCFLRALSTFQGIASLTRNTEKREEYEKDDWPHYFISNSLYCLMLLILRWCESDDEVLRVACEKTLTMINERICFETERSEKTVELLSYSIQCFPYDSKIHSVSIYLPLYRFLVRLLMLQLKKHDKSLLDPLKSTAALPVIFDSVLKIHAMFAQFSANMWKLDDDLIETLTERYYIEDCTINFDSDIQLSQIVASATEPNKFLIEVLEKYGLVDWVNLNLEDHFTTKDDEVEHVNRISEQFLKFLITVLTERYVPGVSCATSEDYLKQDIIHCLCIKPSSRSEIKTFLMPTLEWDTVNRIDNAIEDVAISKSVCASDGSHIFELKNQFFDRFNALYYHYDQQEISDANVFQRQRRKAAGEPDYFPPPELPKLKPFFQPMVSIFQCDVMLHIMQTVIVRFLDSKSQCSSETQLHHVLYLIGHALQEEKSGHYPKLCFTKKAAEWKLLEHLEELLRSDQNALPKGLLQWTIKKYNEITNNTTVEVSLGESASDESKKLKRSQLIAAKRAQIMENMIKMQNQFMEMNLVDNIEETINQPLDSYTKQKLEDTCILCQDTEIIEFENENVLVMPGFVQYSTVLCDNRKNITADYGSPLLSSNLGPAFYISSCGHVMHVKCLKISFLEFDTSESEFFCPLCETFSNAMLPVLPPSSSYKKHQSHISSQLRVAGVQFMNQLKKDTHSNLLQVWKSLSYTVHVVETVLKDSNKPILGHLSSNHQKCLESFIKIAEAASLFYSSDAVYKSNIKMLRSFLTLENPEKKETTIQFESPLRSDIFSLFVAVVFSGIAVIREDNCNILRLVFVAQIVQILIATNFNDMVDDVNIEDETPFKYIMLLFGKKLHRLSEKFVWNYIQKACIPFLRCCVLFYSFLNDGPSPIELTELGGDTFSNMCSYLGFPQRREELFGKKDVYCLVQSWFAHPDVKDHFQKSSHEFGKSDPNRISQLIKLPHTHLELLKQVAVFKCVRSFNKVPSKVHICLVCGEMMCTGICCEQCVEGEVRSPFHIHLKTCGSELYLDVHSNKIMLRSSSELFTFGYVSGPYLDSYGDPEKSVTSSLFLSLEKYKEFHTLMLNHNILEKIIRDIRNEQFTN